jgi:hypothetical protein
MANLLLQRRKRVESGTGTSVPEIRVVGSNLKRTAICTPALQKHSYYGVISRRTRSSDVLDKVQVFHVDGVVLQFALRPLQKPS